MIATTAGLPNTCSQCGADPGPLWYAEHDDAAIAGHGVCPRCAGMSDEPTEPASHIDAPPAPSPVVKRGRR